MEEHGPSDPHGKLRWDGLKAFADGSLGSRTALMHEPYTDQPNTRGIRVTPLEELERLIAAADATGLQVWAPSSRLIVFRPHPVASYERQGSGWASASVLLIMHGGTLHATSCWHGAYRQASTPAGVRFQRGSACALQIAVHAIGDRALDDVKTAYGQAEQLNGKWPGRSRQHRIEHAQHLAGAHVAAELAKGQHVVVSNPLHVLSDRDILANHLGQSRAIPSRSFAFKALEKVTSLHQVAATPWVQPGVGGQR